MVNLAIFGTGVFIVLIGGLGFVGIIPLGSIVNTVNFTSFSSSCTPSGCSTVVTLVNTNATSNYNVYFRLSNSAGQVINIVSQPLLSAPQTTTLTQSWGLLSTGIYTVGVFAISVGGIGISSTLTMQMSTGSVTLTMVGAGVGGTTTPAQGTSTVPINTNVVLTFTAASQYTFSNWLITCDSAYPTPSISTNPYTLLMAYGNCTVTANSNQGGGGCGCFIVTPSMTGGNTLNGPQGTIAPSTPQSIASAGTTSVAFTATANSGSYFVNWQVQEYPSIISTSASFTLTYTALQSASGLTSGNARLVATFINAVSLNIRADPGVSTSPAVGVTTYDPRAGTSVTVTATVLSGYCWAGWSTDLAVQPNPTSLTVTVTMSTSHSVLAQAFPISSGMCKTQPPPGTSWISIALIVAGLGIASVGAFMKKKET